MRIVHAIFALVAALSYTTAEAIAQPPPGKTQVQIVQEMMARGKKGVTPKLMAECVQRLSEPMGSIYAKYPGKVLAQPRPDPVMACIMVQPGFSTPLWEMSVALYVAPVERNGAIQSMTCRFDTEGGVTRLKDVAYAAVKAKREVAYLCGAQTR